jgi:excisionase family DNA binding protein
VTHLLKPAEAADRLGYSTRQIHRWIATGRLRAVRATPHAQWRVPVEALAEFQASCETNEPGFRRPLRAVGR